MAPQYTLPSPPIVENLLLENPWPVACTLLGIAVVLLVGAAQRLERRPVVFAVIAIVLAGCVFAVASLVSTDRERMTVRTHELVQTTAPLDLAQFRSMFEPGATLRGPDGTVWFDLDGVLRELDESVARHGLRGNEVRNIDAHQRSASMGQTLLTVRSRIGSSDADERIVPTQWLITWTKKPDGRWTVSDVQWLRLYTEEPRRGVWR